MSQEILSKREIIFVKEYVLTGHGLYAARKAGYKGEDQTIYVQASRLLKKDKIKTAIKEERESLSEMYSMSHASMTADLVELLRTDITDVVEIEGDDSQQIVKFKPTGILNGKGRYIKSITIGKRGVQVTLESKDVAREMLNKHTGYYGADNEQKKPDGPQIYLPDNQRDPLT